MQLIFDELKIEKQSKNRSSFVLYKKICEVMEEDLQDIFFIYNIYPDTFLDLNPLDGTLKDILYKNNMQECKKEKADLILSILNLHKMNNIKGFFEAIKAKLNKDGIFIGTFFGVSNLYSLGKFLAENDIMEEKHPFLRMLPLLDIKTFGAMLQSSGFRNPVIHSINFDKKFESLMRALQFLKSEGETNCLTKRDNTLLSGNILKKLLANFTESFNLKFDICFFSCLL